jgi:hypothetical protein
MTIDAKIPNKIQTEFNNMSKRTYTMTKSISFQDSSTYANP